MSTSQRVRPRHQGAAFRATCPRLSAPDAPGPFAPALSAASPHRQGRRLSLGGSPAPASARRLSAGGPGRRLSAGGACRTPRPGSAARARDCLLADLGDAYRALCRQVAAGLRHSRAHASCTLHRLRQQSAAAHKGSFQARLSASAARVSLGRLFTETWRASFMSMSAP
jgi:hypothetical protein